MNELDIKSVVEGRGNKDSVEEIYGPMQVGDLVLWEIWIKDSDDDWATRFVEELQDGSHHVYDTFQALSVRLNRMLKDLVDRREELQWKRSRDLSDAQHQNLEKLIRLAVGSLAFLGVISVLAFGLLNGILGKDVALFAMAVVVSSGCGFIFGKYIEPKYKGVRSASGIAE